MALSCSRLWVLWNFLIIGLFLVSSVMSANSRDRETSLSKNIYVTIDGALACFRRMNGTHQAGCSSDIGGSVGVVYLVDSKDSIDWVTKEGPHSPYVVLLYPETFTPEVLGRFQNAEGRVTGILLLKRNDTSSQPAQFSTDLKCPNQGYGLYASKGKSTRCSAWNEVGTSMLHQSWNFPIFYVENEQKTESLLDCFGRFNKPYPDGTLRDWPLCAAELQSYMLAAVDSPTCIRRTKISSMSISPSKICDPLGDLNIWSTLVPSIQSEPHPETEDGSVIVIGARLDASSMIDQLSPGADSTATGLTALLALMKQLAPLKDSLKDSNITNIYFILFNGEAFDYIGSSRLVYDMMRDKFPAEIQDNSTTLPALLKLTDIKYFIELDQLALSSGDSYYIHRNWDAPLTATNNNSLPTLIQILQDYGNNTYNLPLVDVHNDSGMGLPPSSLQAFLDKSLDLPGIVITNHKAGFRNKYYNSIFDNARSIGYTNTSDAPDTVTGIASLVATIAATVEELVFGKKPRFSNIKPDPVLINDILQCYVKSAKCDLFRKVTNGEVDNWLPNNMETFPLYVGVSQMINSITGITRNIMAFYQGETVNRTEDGCLRTETDTMNLNYVWMNGSCFETSTSTSPAVSPAFDDDNYDWGSGKYSTWTESVWHKLSVRIFLKPSMAHQVLTLSFGIAVFAISIVIFSFINGKTDILFNSRYEGYSPVPPN